MHPILNEIRKRAKKRPKRIVLPETGDLRVIEAAKKVGEEMIAEIILLGNEEDIKNCAENNKIWIKWDNYKIVNPASSDKLNSYAEKYFELRKHKGITKEEAEETLKNPLFYGAMMVRQGDADGMLAGSVAKTSEVYGAALRVVGPKEKGGLVSGVYMMLLADGIEYGAEVNGRHVVAFADAVLNQYPTAEELASIGVDTAETFKKLFPDVEPHVAFLSYSTKGSSECDYTRKAVEAVSLAKEMNPDLKVDGELQIDAAVVPHIAEAKAPGSEVGGKTNVFIFPDISSGNIAYKSVERFGGARAIGPISQGLNKPVNDLSRGCSIEDIVDMIAITSLMAE